MESVEIAPLETDRFERVLGSDRYRTFARAVEAAVECFADRVLWCVNSTAKGGGVAELLSSMMGYLSGAGIDARWAVIEGDDDFFALTKRIHNRLHGITPMPYAWHAGSTSSSTVRSVRLYRHCSEASPSRCRPRAVSFACAMCHPAKLLDPT